MVRNLKYTVVKRIYSVLLCTRVQLVTLESPFGSGGVSGFLAQILDGSLATPFIVKPDRFVYYLQFPQGNYYLKRSTHQTPRSVLRHLLRGRRAHTDAVSEGIAVKILESKGFKVMEPVAWGEELWLGVWPRRGFLLVKEVVGQELVNLLDTEKVSSLRNSSLEAMGKYVGRLHGMGFYHAPRVRDFIIEGSNETNQSAPELTMIDIDFKGLRLTPRPFYSNHAIEALAESCFILLRTGQSVNRAGALRFIRGYRRGICQCGHHLSPGYLKRLVFATDRRLKMICSDPEQKAQYQEAFTSVAAGISEYQ